jgi:hypothetical protein
VIERARRRLDKKARRGFRGWPIATIALLRSCHLSTHRTRSPAGIMHRRYLKAPRNIGFSATVSARALKVAGTSFRGFFHQVGIRPQRIGTISRPTISRSLMRDVTTSMNV